MSTGSEAGTVAALYRYPIKSMRGEALTEAEVSDRGIHGDRALALIDPEYEGVVSAKQPRKWRRMLECWARLADEPATNGDLAAWIQLPDGREIRSDDPAAEDALSALFERPVRIEARPPEKLVRETLRPAVPGLADEERLGLEPMARSVPGTFFDAAPLHVLTTATLRALREIDTGGSIDAARFRPNIVIESDEQGFVEQSWLGRTVAIGDVRLQLIDPTARCVVTTLPQREIPANPGLLHTLAAKTSSTSVTAAPGRVMRAVVGVYARVVTPGTVRPHDRVQLL